ncbi:MAG TPA: lamin tail domain-containing protein [Verrucomicrobiae bacterium]
MPTFNSNATNAHSTLAIEEFRFGPATLVAGTNILAIQGLNVAISDPDFLVLAELVATHTASASGTPVYFTVPSPGAANSGGVAVPGPAILAPTHSPNVPLDADDIVVTARVLPTFNPVAGVTLRYRTMFDPEVPVAMLDDGLHGDGAAGDGVFGATIPASAGTNGQMIRWYFSAADVAGNTSRWPLFTDPANTPEYLGTIVDPTNVTSKLPIFHLFAAPGVVQPAPPTTQTGADSESGGRVAVFYDGEFYDNVYMELRGNTSAGQQKKSHRLEFNREHTFRHLPEFPRVRKTSFMAEFLDPAYLRQHLCFWLLDQMGVPSPFFYPVRVQLNGSFYSLAYHNDAIDEEQVARLGYDPAGALYKAAGVCAPSEFSTGVFQKKTDPLADHSDYQALVRAINETNYPPGQSTNVSLRRIAAFDMLDIPEIINYLAGARWCAENDDVWANMSLYRDTTNGHGDGLWRIIPFDMNASWGQRYGGITPLDAIADNCKSHPLYGGSATPACDSPSSPNNFNRMYDVIIAVPETRQMLLRRQRTVLDRWVLEQGVAAESRLLESHIRYMTNLIWTEAFLDRAKWGYSTWTASNKPLTNAVNELFNEFINLRRIHWSVTHNVTNVTKPIGITPTSNAGIPVTQLPNAVVLISGIEFNPSSGDQDQEYICLTNPLPYAVDLSGWHLGGGVSHTFHPGTVMPSNSVMYLSPNIVAFRTRALSPRGGQGLFVQGNYKNHLSAWGETLTLTDDTGRLVSTSGYAPAPSLAQQYLRVTEIMYNPSPLAGNTNDAQEFEYIELKNIGPADLDLRGVRFTNGIEFAFSGSAVTNLAPGAKVLVVRNQSAFTARYGGGASIAGPFAGALDSNGETLRLEDATGEKILEFAYNNSWYPITDGYGFSLVIVNENAYWDTWGDKASWRPSGVVNGSPGQDDPAPPLIAGILINELLSHSLAPDVDVIELYNPTAGDVNIGGWFITDDATNAFKFRIPDGTMIAAGAYKTFNEADFNPTPGTPPSFAFSSKGDEAYLFSGDASTNLTGYIYGFSFDAGETNVTFGRHVSSDGKVHFVAQSANTLGTNNAAPKVGPLIFSEIMYHPSDRPGGADNSDDEFIELRNITSADVALFDPGAATNTWRLRGGVDFVFPANTNLAANGYLLLANFNPTNSAKLAAFRAKFNVSAGIPIFGPYSGKLNNSSDTVKLYKPDAPVGGEVPYILVEAVDYKDSSPWTSAADGSGASLHRVNLSTFGNEPTNWIAATPSPGAAVGVGAAPAITAQPASQNGALAFGATFSVSATGAEPLYYQWRFGGSALAGATNSTLSLSNLKLDQSGDYSVIVFNAAGSAVSSNATLTVLFPPSFFLQPAGRGVHPGTNVTLTAGGTGTLPLSYQWQLNTVDLPGATNASYSLVNVQPPNAGNYSVVLSNPAGSITSSVASLIVFTHPVITADLTNITVKSGTNVTFAIAATTSTPILYQWSRDGTNIIGATNSTFIITNVQPASQGAFSVLLANSYGSILSSTSVLSVLVTPFYTQQPMLSSGPFGPATNLAVLQGATVSISVAANGSPLPFGIRWRWKPANPPTASTRDVLVITNLFATNATYTLVDVNPTNSGNYNLVITNTAGTAGLSATAILTVLADNDRDGIDDDWERLYGMDTNSVANASADPDMDGMTNLQEYLAGTDPTNGLSYLKIDSIVLNNATNTLLTLSAVSNRTYSVICRDDVATGMWVRLADIDARATNRIVTVTNQLPAGAPYRFYRLQTPKLR